MARRILTISNIIKIDDNTTSIGCGLIDQNINIHELTNLKNKIVKFIDENDKQHKIKIIDLQVNYSLAGFKNVFLLVKNKDAENLKEGYEIEYS